MIAKIRALAGKLRRFSINLTTRIFVAVFGDSAVEEVVKTGELSRDQWITLHPRPRKSTGVGTLPHAVVPQERVGIVLQGPIITVDDFTLNTINIYKKHFTEADLVVSTWESEPPAALEAIRRSGVKLVLNRKPDVPGTANVNMQLTSAFGGIRECQAMGLKYALKTRTDQRMYAPNALGYLRAMLAAFPPSGGFNQSGRIVGVSMNTFKYRMYGLSDFLTFGHIEDQMRYWGAPADTRKIDTAVPMSMGEHARQNMAEVYFASHFLQSVGRNLAWTLADSWQAFADHFCIVDQSSLDFFWPKYAWRREYRYLSYDRSRTNEEMSFQDWLMLYTKQIDLSRAPVAALDRQIGQEV